MIKSTFSFSWSLYDFYIILPENNQLLYVSDGGRILKGKNKHLYNFMNKINAKNP